MYVNIWVASWLNSGAGKLPARHSTRASIVINDLFPYRLPHCKEILLLSNPPSNYDLITMQDQAVSTLSSKTSHWTVQIYLLVLINTKTILQLRKELQWLDPHLHRASTFLSLHYFHFTQIVILTTTWRNWPATNHFNWVIEATD